jgi:hypothetical protein
MLPFKKQLLFSFQHDEILIVTVVFLDCHQCCVERFLVVKHSILQTERRDPSTGIVVWATQHSHTTQQGRSIKIVELFISITKWGTQSIVLMSRKGKIAHLPRVRLSFRLFFLSLICCSWSILLTISSFVVVFQRAIRFCKRIHMHPSWWCSTSILRFSRWTKTPILRSG